MAACFVRRGPRNLITDVEGILVGNAEDHHVRTGVTVIVPEGRAVAAVDVRGGGPGTRETDALDPANLVDAVDAIVLSGGSSYGLDAASGVVNFLGAKGRGFTLGASPKVSPVVPAAILFDLMNGGDKEWGEAPPYRQLGREAALRASADFALGNAGAGLGAAAGTLKGGLGSASAMTQDGLTIGALIAANPFGSVLVPGTDRFWAAPYEMDGEFGGRGWAGSSSNIAGLAPMMASKADAAAARNNTTIGVVALDADLTPAEARRIAIMAQDGLARAIRPIHTPFDGDVIFVLATGRRPLGTDMRPFRLAEAGAIAADCVARAVARGVYEAESLGSAEGYRTRYGL